jgi:4-diphosphocytidyl-2-C-methyl-D-erythritol kinase
MKTTFSLKAYAKINLYLEVLGLRPDQYHEVETIIQSISLHDLITFEEIDRDIKITCTDATLPTDSRNLAYRAADLMKNTYHVTKGVHIHIEKNIPIGAGLGGGSTDAATVLLGCQQLWEVYAPIRELEKLGVQLGMDVPFCLQGGTAFASGRGEHIQLRFPTPVFDIVLVYPNLHISTKEIYQRIDAEPAMLSIRQKNTTYIAQQMFNRLEDATLPAFPELVTLKENLKAHGCLGVLMSGSGSSVFGICSSPEQAAKIAAAIKSQTGYWTSALTSIAKIKS